MKSAGQGGASVGYSVALEGNLMQEGGLPDYGEGNQAKGGGAGRGWRGMGRIWGGIRRAR